MKITALPCLAPPLPCSCPALPLACFELALLEDNGQENNGQ